MRILFITTSYPSPSNPTAGIFVHLLATHLFKRGHHIRVITPGDESQCGTTVFENIEVERVWYAPRRLRILAQYPGGIPAILRAKPYLFCLLPFLLFFMIVRVAKCRSHYEIIHGHWWVTGIVHKLSSLAKQDKPFVVTLRGSDVKLLSIKIIKSIFLKLNFFENIFFTAVSQSLLEELSFFFKKDKQKKLTSSRFVPNGIEKEFFKTKPCNSSEMTKLLYIGSIIPRKRVDKLVEACKIALEKGCNLNLEIIGEGTDREKVVNLIFKYRLHQRITITPYVPHHDIPLLFEDVHCFVLFSESEGRPNVVIEAMAAGRAILATDLPCIRELMGEVECGYIASSDNIHAFAEAIVRACQDRQLLRQMGANARKRILELGLDWDNTAEKYEQIYRLIGMENSEIHDR